MNKATSSNAPISESQILAGIMLALGARPDCRVFRMNVGVAKDPRTGQVVKFGVPGMSDLLVLVRTQRGAEFLWLEVKSATGRIRPEQERFLDMIHAIFGSLHGRVVRSVDDATAAVAALLGDTRG